MNKKTKRRRPMDYKDDDRHRIKASIPPGVRTGSRVRMAGQGEPGCNSEPAGDLYLIVHILPNGTFEREGDNLYMEVPVDIFTAIAGGETQVPTLERSLLNYNPISAS